MSRALRSLRRPLRRLWRQIVDAVLPWACPVCAAVESGRGGVCASCAANLEVRPWQGCMRCGEPLTPSGSCVAEHRELRNLAFLAAPFDYAGTGGALVRRFKLDGDAGAGELLAVGMARRLRPHLAGPWRRAILVPVPLHRTKRRSRGFDQATWLANTIGRKHGLAVAGGLLRRVRPTLPQGDPRNTNREANVDGAFAIAAGRSMAGRRVILVDDVATSVATLRECARLLRGGGVAAVAAVVGCRA